MECKTIVQVMIQQKSLLALPGLLRPWTKSTVYSTSKNNQNCLHSLVKTNQTNYSYNFTANRTLLCLLIVAHCFTITPFTCVCCVVRQTAAGKSTGSNEISKSAEDTPPVDFSKIDNRLPLKIQDSERTEYVSPVSIKYNTMQCKYLTGENLTNS